MVQIGQFLFSPQCYPLSCKSDRGLIVLAQLGPQSFWTSADLKASQVGFCRHIELTFLNSGSSVNDCWLALNVSEFVPKKKKTNYKFFKISHQVPLLNLSTNIWILTQIKKTPFLHPHYTASNEICAFFKFLTFSLNFV